MIQLLFYRSENIVDSKTENNRSQIYLLFEYF